MQLAATKEIFQFRAKEIRDILRSKAHCLHAGFSPDDIIIITLNEIRDDYIRRVGLTTYLSQMLGNLSIVEMQYCTLYQENGQPVKIHLNGRYNQSVQRFIAKNFRPNQLPFKIEIRKTSSPKRVDFRYL